MADLGEDLPWPADAIEVARIIDAYGVKGWIKVQPYAADPQALFSSRRWFLKPGLTSAASATILPKVLRITDVKEHGDFVIAAVREVGDRTAAESLRGSSVHVSRGSFPTAGVDEFYWVDLIGLAVINRQGDVLGEVSGLIDTGPHSVLRVAEPNAAAKQAGERLIPFVAAYVDDVSLDQRRITVDWGLDY